MSLEDTERECAEGKTAPRVSLQDIENAIVHKHFVTADKTYPSPTEAVLSFADDALSLLTVCFVVMNNGFTVIGKSVPASPANFDAQLGRKLAYEDAVRQIWPLMGFALRARLAG